MNTAHCEICGNTSWTVAHEGSVRDGTFDRIIDDATVRRCGGGSLLDHLRDITTSLLGIKPKVQS